MEGVVDWPMRDLLTRIGGIDFCVTEFMRVTNHLHGDEQFYKYSPELKTKSFTAAGTPVIYQLLGGQPDPLAENALRACELGAIGIDLNFGCPAKTVNRHDGGATLLQFPERLYKIVKTVRQAVPANLSMSAKIRLGFMDKSLYLENSKAIEEAGATWLAVHARTKLDGYRPPAYWEHLAEIKNYIKIPVIANGEIWTLSDFIRCREISQCQHFMIGRGLIANPNLALEIKSYLNSSSAPKITVWPLIKEFFELSSQYREASYATARTKQWLRQLSARNSDFTFAFDTLKVLHDSKQFAYALNSFLKENHSGLNHSELPTVLHG